MYLSRTKASNRVTLRGSLVSSRCVSKLWSRGPERLSHRRKSDLAELVLSLLDRRQRALARPRIPAEYFPQGRARQARYRAPGGAGCQPSTLRMLICPEASSAQNNTAAVSADGRTVWVLIRRLNSSCKRSIALVVRRLRHWLGGRRAKVAAQTPIKR